MKWNHLPASGGMDQQNPILLQRFRIAFQIRNAWEANQAKKKENETMGGKKVQVKN